MSRTVSPAAPLLNPDVLTEIFARLENRQFGTWSWNDAKLRQQQRELHQLKLVCKQFNDISTSQPELVQGLHLHSNFPRNATVSLLAWLRRSSGAVQTFTSSCDTSSMHAVMAGLIASSPLRVLDISNTTSWSMQLAAAFTSLEKCALQQKSGEVQYLDLTPLQGLPKLQHLHLQGHFRQLHRLPSLTALEFKAAQGEVGNLGTMLQFLVLKDSSLQGVHAHALQACTALTELVLSAARLLGTAFGIHLTRDLVRIPDGMRHDCIN